MNQTWWKEAVVYQIYPRSFCDSNGDGIGDLQGIISKLDYIKELGVDVIWLSPIYRSPNNDNGYDISDYQDIMEEFGTMADFDQLLEEAHRRGLRIIMDLVVNHTSNQHKWFLESRKSRDNPYRDFYIWREGKDGKLPNNWGAWFGGPAWEYDKQTDMYYLHLFTPEQPDLNWENEIVRKKIYEMMTWWLDKGIDGFRMDVISMISKVPGLPDGELLETGYGDVSHACAHGPRVHEFLQEMNREVLSKYDIMTVGETACVTVEEAKKYSGFDRHELNTVFQFEVMDMNFNENGKWNDLPVQLTKFKSIFNKWQTELDGCAWNALFLGNHDQPRSLSRFGNDTTYRVESAKMLGTCLHMMQGTPYIFQGDEIGMTNAYFEDLNDYRDIESYNVFHHLTEEKGMPKETVMRYLQLVSRDNGRTPMQWNDQENAGFTTGTPWISVNKNYHEINAAAATKDKNSIFSYYQKLISLRHRSSLIVYGSFHMLMPDSEEIFAYERVLEEQKLVVLCNFTDQTVDYAMDLSGYEKLIGNYDGILNGQLRPYEAVVVQKNMIFKD